MSSEKLLGKAGRSLIGATVLTVLFCCGVVTGLCFYPRVFPPAQAADAHESEHHHDAEEEGPHIALTKQAAQNLQLKMGFVPRGDYWKSHLVPGQVVEIPGQSDLGVSAPVTGVVSRVEVLPGQSIRPQHWLMEIQLTDQALTDAQSKLLTTLTSQEVAKQELNRLRPLINEGTVSGIKARELEYELKQLNAQQAVLTQELLGRGLPKESIAQIIAQRELATSLRVSAPDYVKDHDTLAKSTGYSIEKINVHPGMAVERGDLLCNVAYHAELYLRGTAFEQDLAILNRIAEEDWKIEIELPQPDAEGNIISMGKVSLLRVDNHVAETSQTVNFYAVLSNKVTREQLESGRQFEQWQFRPGQRLHLRLPIDQWHNQLVLPAQAVVVDGPNVMIFAEHQPPATHSHDSNESPWEKQRIEKEALQARQAVLNSVPADYQPQPVDSDIELEPVPVRMLYRDDRTVVIADDGQVPPGLKVAINNAQAVYLAMKMQASGGGGHHHDHEH